MENGGGRIAGRKDRGEGVRWSSPAKAGQLRSRLALVGVMGEVLVDGIDMELGEGVEGFGGEEVVAVLLAVHEEVLGEHGDAGGALQHGELGHLGLAPNTQASDVAVGSADGKTFGQVEGGML